MKKGTFGKDVTLDEAYDMGYQMGIRNTLNVLVREQCFNNDLIALVLEEKYIKDIEKLDI